MASWLEIRVFYLRVSQCLRDENPQILTINFPSREIYAALEVNGGRISPSENALITLRRDRVDTESLEATYVSTDNLRAFGSLPFEVDDGEGSIVYGALQQSDPSLHELRLDSRPYSGWNMECGCAIGPSGCAFTKSRRNLVAMLGGPPTVEICVVGTYNGSPLILTQSIRLATRRRIVHCGTLDAISEEYEECNTDQSNLPSSNQYGRIDGKLNMPQTFHKLNSQATYLEDDDRNESWFNSGVRVGVGIGLGVCLGIAIGVGLIVRTYQLTTKSFKRTRL